MHAAFVTFPLNARTELPLGKYFLGDSTITVSGDGAIGIHDNDGTAFFSYEVKVSGHREVIARISNDIKRDRELPMLAKLAN
jgi:hypothetical protein